ncbi:hypothetical protein M3J09_003708 [Ascochyta lentis]
MQGLRVAQAKASFRGQKLVDARWSRISTNASRVGCAALVCTTLLLSSVWETRDNAHPIATTSPGRHSRGCSVSSEHPPKLGALVVAAASSHCRA